MEYKDYYKIMGLERNATQEEIKRVYRKLARKYHPDVSKEPQAEAHFKELGEAYEVLKDPSKRAKYDQLGQYWKEHGQDYTPHSEDTQQSYQYHGNENGQAADFEEFINSIFNQRRHQQYSSHFAEGQDIHAKLAINLEDSYLGTEKTLQLQTPHSDHYGAMQYESRTVKVKIPKGIADKQQIRLKGQGGKNGSSAGDLYIEIQINPHPWFHVEKKNIYLDLPIAPWEATLGATIKVPTLTGDVSLKIPPLSQSGKQLRLKGKGLPGNPTGDQYVKLNIVIPTTTNDEVKKLYQQMETAITFNPREKFGVNDGKA